MTFDLLFQILPYMLGFVALIGIAIIIFKILQKKKDERMQKEWQKWQELRHDG